MKSNLAVCMSSEKHDWGTPQDLFDHYDALYHFDLDAAATLENRKVANFIGPPGYQTDNICCVGIDALTTVVWPGDRCWLNSPYGRELARWYAKAVEQALKFGKLVAMLAPARTDTSYWHEFVWDAEMQRPHPWVLRLDFLKGRVKFEGATAGAPFPSAVVVFGWSE